MEIANVNENYIVNEFNPTIAISIQCLCTNTMNHGLLYNQLQCLPEFRSHTHIHPLTPLCKCVECRWFFLFHFKHCIWVSFWKKINQPNRSIFFFAWKAETWRFKWNRNGWMNFGESNWLKYTYTTVFNILYTIRTIHSFTFFLLLVCCTLNYTIYALKTGIENFLH